MNKEIIPDVLAERYASTAMVRLFSVEQKVILERRLWIAVMKAQSELGLTIPSEAIQAYEAVINATDLESIKKRELTTKHDVKARIEEFNQLAGGYEFIHQGFTSRDLTDNIEQLQIMEALKIVRNKTVSALNRLGIRACQFKDVDMCGRSHNVPGQTITLGKRHANLADEMMIGFSGLEHLISVYSLRGIKGAMGTQQDMLDLLGSREKVLLLEGIVREKLGFPRVFDSVGQVYPRSLDYEVASRLVQLSSPMMNFSNNIRLMAGFGQVNEGFSEGQTGSTGQPHKMNTRTSERIRALGRVIGGFCHMIEALTGDQWGEGDVSCSVVRRVAMPGIFFAIDGLFESFLTVVTSFTVYSEAIELELQRNLPFLSSTKLLMAAVKKGMGREKAHKIIKIHSTVALKAMAHGEPNTFLKRLAEDAEFGFTFEELQVIVGTPDHGLAEEQVDRVVNRINFVCRNHRDAMWIEPEPIL